MESNQLGSGKLENLQVGETLLVDAKKVKNGKIQLHFAEKLTGNDKPINALTMKEQQREKVRMEIILLIKVIIFSVILL